MDPSTYREAGVDTDTDAGDEAVRRIAPLARAGETVDALGEVVAGPRGVELAS